MPAPTDLHVIVPARLASLRLPEKLLLDLGGEPLILKTLRQVNKAQPAALIVATDHPRIYDVVSAAGYTAMMTSAAHVSGTDRLAETVERLNWPDDTIVVNVQGDEPFIDPDCIIQLHQSFIERPDCAVATCAYPIESAESLSNPNVVKVITNTRDQAIYFSRAPIPYARDQWQSAQSAYPITNLEHRQHLQHIGIYAYRVKHLKKFPLWDQSPLETLEKLEQLRFIEQGERIFVLRVPKAPTHGIDTLADLESARKKLAQME